MSRCRQLLLGCCQLLLQFACALLERRQLGFALAQCVLKLGERGLTCFGRAWPEGWTRTHCGRQAEEGGG